MRWPADPTGLTYDSRDVPQPGSPPPTLIIDFHRVVIDSEYALYRLWRDQFHQRGLLLTTEAWAEHRITGDVDAMSDNGSPEAIANILARRIGAPIADFTGLAHQLTTQHHAALAALPARPGITTWLQEAHRTGWRCVVIAAADDAYVRAALTARGLSDLVHMVIQTPVVRASQGRQGPSSLYQPALTYLDADTRHTVVVTASPTGVAQAHVSGCGCLAVPDKLNTHLLRSESGVAVVNPELISLPRAVALLADSKVAPRRRTRGGPDRAYRVWGSLAGLALGDAVGKLVGYRTKDQLDTETQRVLGALSLGQEPPAVFTGRVTDDTVLTLALADTIIASDRISRDAFQACLKAINPQGGWQVFKLKASTDPLAVAPDGDTNGCVPRSAVLAYLHTPDTMGDLVYDVLKIATLTHADPSALATAMLFAVALTYAVDGCSPQEVLAAMESLYASVIRMASGGEDVCAALHRHATASRRFDTPTEYVDYLEDNAGTDVTARSSAVTGLCLGLAGLPVHQILPALMRRRSRGDLDSTAAIYGALTGAFHPNSIPTNWTNRIDRYCDRTLRKTTDQLQRIHNSIP